MLGARSVVSAIENISPIMMEAYKLLTCNAVVQNDTLVEKIHLFCGYVLRRIRPGASYYAIRFRFSLSGFI